MSSPAVVLFLLLLVILLCFLTGQGKRKFSIKGSEKPDNRPVFPTDPMPTQRLAVEDAIQKEEAVTLDEEVIGRIKAGMETIYTHPFTMPYPSAPPLEMRNIDSEMILSIRDSLSKLKNFRLVHEDLQRVLNDPKVRISDISTFVVSDPVLASKILRVANSPYFGIPGKIDSIGHALMILGTINVKNLLYREGLLQFFLTGDPEKNRVMEKIWKHATLTSICAAHLHPLFGGLNQGSLFTMGLLHDIGKFILLLSAGAWKNERNTPLKGLKLDQEDRLFGVNHAVVGEMALSEWGFSDLMVKVVANHHGPAYKERGALKMDRIQLPCLIVLFLADQLAKQIDGGEPLSLEALHPSYRQIVDRTKLQTLLQEKAFLSQIRKSIALSLSLSQQTEQGADG